MDGSGFSRPLLHFPPPVGAKTGPFSTCFFLFHLFYFFFFASFGAGPSGDPVFLFPRNWKTAFCGSRRGELASSFFTKMLNPPLLPEKVFSSLGVLDNFFLPPRLGQGPLLVKKCFPFRLLKLFFGPICPFSPSTGHWPPLGVFFPPSMIQQKSVGEPPVLPRSFFGKPPTLGQFPRPCLLRLESPEQGYGGDWPMAMPFFFF